MDTEEIQNSWQTLLALPYEVQIVLFAGYAGYKIATIGRPVRHRTEDFLLQVLLFGTIGRLAVAGAMLSGFTLPDGDSARLFIVGTTTLFVSMLSAAVWRMKLQKVWWQAMSWINVYHDDHEPSAFASVLAEKARWRLIQIHCDDGRVYESDFEFVPDNLPLGRILLNDDGVTMYVTRIYRPDETEVDLLVRDEGYGYRVNYFPTATIKRLEIGWRA
jgi:hypothetical protein